MLLVKIKVFLDLFGYPQNSFLVEWHTHNLNAYRHALRVFKVSSDQFGHWIFVITFIVQLIASGESDRLRNCTHSENVEDIGVGSQEGSLS